VPTVHGLGLVAPWTWIVRLAQTRGMTTVAALREAVDAAETSIAAGRFDRVPADGLRDYIRQLGQEAAAVVSARPA
jgi:hypothetical protein